MRSDQDHAAEPRRTIRFAPTRPPALILLPLLLHTVIPSAADDPIRVGVLSEQSERMSSYGCDPIRIVQRSRAAPSGSRQPVRQR